MYYIYILYSEKYDKYYVGHTDNPERRLEEHNKLSEKSYTSHYRPWKIAGVYEVGADRGQAMKVERHIKKQKSKAYLKGLIKRGTIDKIIDRYSSVG